MHTNRHPEKVLQFGTGILLRGLPDYFIDKANRQSKFNGSILVVKSTEGATDEFAKYGSRYTICVRGTLNGVPVEENILNTAISRVVSAQEGWSEVLRMASSPDFSVVISNTTEVGIQFEPESIFKIPPATFPGKLTAVLYERFKKCGEGSSDLVIVPTELIPDNGKKLKDIVLKLTHHNRLDPDFTSWLDRKVIFCNSLVDRIVTKPSNKVRELLSGWNNLTIQVEPYKLWAIEGDERAKKVLSFADADPAVIIAPSIEHYRERKLRIVNGAGTVTANVGFLRGIDTFYQCMQQKEMAAYVEDVVLKEIEPTLPEATRSNTKQFAKEVLERWRNPFTVHHLLSITLQGTAKTKMRNVPTFLRYLSQFNSLPSLLTDGFAAHVLFMKGVRKEGDKYFGSRRGEEYAIQDDQAGYFFEIWKDVDTADKASLKKLVVQVCGNKSLWDTDLSTLPGFVEAVTDLLSEWVKALSR